MSESIYYVYSLSLPDGTPCYIGKGKGSRWKDHWRKTSNSDLSSLLAEHGENIICDRLADGLFEQEALDLERFFIAAVGRKLRGGPLVNRTDGGQGVSGLRHSVETRAKASERMKKHFENPVARRSTSLATRNGMISASVKAAISAAQKRRYSDQSERENAALRGRGKKQSEMTIKKKCDAIRGQKRSAESRAKMSAWQIGRKMSVEAREKMSAAATARYASASVNSLTV